MFGCLLVVSLLVILVAIIGFWGALKALLGGVMLIIGLIVAVMLIFGGLALLTGELDD